MMSHEPRCHLGCMSGDSEIETVDGPVAIGTLVGKRMPVLTRLPDGRVGFRLMTGIERAGEGVPVVRVTFDNGQSVVVDPEHVFYRKGMEECATRSLQAGDILETSFHFPEGYELERSDGSHEPSAGAVRVAGIEDAGTADVFTGAVNETASYFTSAGALCKA
jgi:hypothetical protein